MAWPTRHSLEDLMSNRIPRDGYAMIIGAMKCGTSSLFRYLEGHPQICPASRKEPGFFTEKLKKYDRAATSHYHDLWNFDPGTHKYALEASTGYTKYPLERNVAQSIYDYGIRPKFIYLLRNPFDRIVSHFNYQHLNPRPASIVDDHLVHTSNYFMQLDQYTRLFPLESMLLLDFDELQDRPRELLRRVYRFLGLSDEYMPEAFEVVNRTAVESKPELVLTDGPVLRVARALPTPMRESTRRMLAAFKGPAKKQTLSPRQREYVHEKLEDGMRCLHETYGFDVRKWGFNP